MPDDPIGFWVALLAGGESGIVTVYVSAADRIAGVQFGFKEGSRSQAFGNCNGAGAIDFARRAGERHLHARRQ